MSVELIIIPNSLSEADWKYVHTDNVIESLQAEFEAFPESARLYNGQVAQCNDVTPRTEADIAHLLTLQGPIYCVNYPQGWETLAYLAIAVIAAVAVVAFRPKIPTATNRNVQAASPNNALSGRTNQIRINGRIPDIFGQVRSTPDLIAVPYSIFENNKEVEYTFMAIGRGSYQIDGNDYVRDGTTPVARIDGETVEVFGPNTSPNTGDAPQLRIGSAISRKVISAVRSKSVNGQTLLAPNEDVINDAGETFDFLWPNKINSNGSEPDFTDTFVAGDSAYLTEPGFYRESANINQSVDAPNYRVAFTNDLITDLASYHATFTQTHNARFYPDGRIEFQSLTDIGTATRPMNDDGRLFLQLEGATFSGIDLSGKYICTATSGSVLQCETPTNSRADWSSISTVTAYKACTFKIQASPFVQLSGSYLVDSLVANQLTLSTPANMRVNNDWVWLHYLGSSSRKNNQHAFISKTAATDWIGPFVIDVATATELILNFVALQGMYRDNGITQTAATVTLQAGYGPCDSSGTLTGAESFVAYTLTGDDFKRSTVAGTLFIQDLTGGRYAVRVRRLTAKDLAFEGQVSDEVKWRDLYASSPVGNVHWGDITTVHCKTIGTEQALAVSERQINLLVTRKLPQRTSGSNFTTTLYATKSADEIISWICLDPKIGNRDKAEINFTNIYATVAAVKSYFGFNEAGEFSYTIDSDNISFEETLQLVANAIFCDAQRRNGSLIELNFEKATSNSAILFNHRNKVPGSEVRSVTFGNIDDNDGVEYEYVSPDDDAITTIYIPADRSAVKPRKFQSVGVRNVKQATVHAYREFNRIRYQNTTVDFEATQEAELISRNSRILVADNTRPDTQDGEIVGQNALILQLSQPAVLKSGVSYIISLQLASGLVQNIGITAGVDDYHVVLDGAPAEALVLDDNAATRTLYQIVRVDETDKAAFLVIDKSNPSNFISRLQAINYDARYYANDLDFHA